MPKHFKSTERFLTPDPQFGNKLVSKFVNCLMRDGKKSVAYNLFYDALDRIKKRIPDKSPVDVFVTAVSNVKPLVEVRSKRVGGANYQVPKDVGPRRQQALAIRWLLEAVRKKKGRPTAIRLADELLAAYKKEGAAITVRENTHKMAEANKAFSHFTW